MSAPNSDPPDRTSTELSKQPTVLSARAVSERRVADEELGFWPRARSKLRPLLAGMRFAGLVPAIVLVFGLAAAVSITVIGVQQLRQQSDSAAALRARLLAVTLAERLSEAKEDERPLLIERAAIRSGAELLLANASGKVLADGSLKPPPAPGVVQLLIVGEGETQTPLGRVRFFAAPLPAPNDEISVLTFVSAPKRPIATESLVRVVGLFTAVLLGVAALVAFALARDVHADVAYVRERIVQMARPDSSSIGQTVPVRTVDQVGAMTNAFNELVERFSEAEVAYKDDLHLAMTMERERSAFLAALSHELRTPLNVILGFADVLLAEVEGPLTDEARENLEVVRNSGAHLKALIKDILDLSALESGELTLAREMIDLVEVAQAVVNEHRLSAQAKGLQLKFEGSPAQAWADPVRVRQIIGNLLGNAIKFTREGEVTVAVETRDGQATVSVRDSGPGIAAKEQAAIFDDFSQVGDLRARGAGSGLGLAITRRLVHMHSGKIYIRSELGRGAEFLITLPNVARGRSLSKARLRPALSQGGAFGRSR